LEASLPLWFVVLDSRTRGSMFRNKMIVAGLLLGFLGILLLFFNQLRTDGRDTGTMAIFGALAVIASCIFWALASLYNVRKFHDTPLLAGLVWQISGGLVFCLITSGILGEWKKFEPVSVTRQAWLGVGYLAVAGSVIALMSYNWLLRQWPSAVVGTYAYINPVIAVIIGYFVANEAFGIFEFSGMVAILFAAWMVNKGRARINWEKER
jgi:drug/metabolite transporter (DMT)-like permease